MLPEQQRVYYPLLPPLTDLVLVLQQLLLNLSNNFLKHAQINTVDYQRDNSGPGGN